MQESMKQSMSESDRVIAGLKQNGYRITQARRTILDVILAAETSLSPQEIFERARDHYRRLGLVSVYRTLDLFMDLGLVERVHRESDCHGYIRTSHGHRHQLICQDCGRIEEFTGCKLEAQLPALTLETGYVVERHSVTVEGHCPDCQRAKAG